MIGNILEANNSEKDKGSFGVKELEAEIKRLQRQLSVKRTKMASKTLCKNLRKFVRNVDAETVSDAEKVRVFDSLHQQCIRYIMYVADIGEEDGLDDSEFIVEVINEVLGVPPDSSDEFWDRMSELGEEDFGCD
jgi:translation initiation factor 2B subunit (eIF-2B alpha/beta/delta family)